VQRAGARLCSLVAEALSGQTLWFQGVRRQGAQQSAVIQLADSPGTKLPHLHRANCLSLPLSLSLSLSLCHSPSLSLFPLIFGGNSAQLAGFFLDGGCTGLRFLRWDVYSRGAVCAPAGAGWSLEF